MTQLTLLTPSAVPVSFEDENYQRVVDIVMYESQSREEVDAAYADEVFHVCEDGDYPISVIKKELLYNIQLLDEERRFVFGIQFILDTDDCYYAQYFNIISKKQWSNVIPFTHYIEKLQELYPEVEITYDHHSEIGLTYTYQVPNDETLTLKQVLHHIRHENEQISYRVEKACAETLIEQFKQSYQL